MWPLWLIILVAVAGAVLILVTGVCLAVRWERRRHQRILRKHLAVKDLTKYHRPRLSAQEVNYPHVLLPFTSLRRSVQMPFGIVTIGSSEYPSTSTIDEEKDGQTNTIMLHDPEEVPRPKHSRNIRSSFSGRSLYNPKSRRQKKIGQVINVTAHTSPLSAITEFTDSQICTSPPMREDPLRSPTIAEPKKAFTRAERQFSIQWPLTMSKGRADAAPTEVLSMAARASMLMRMGGNVHHSTKGVKRPTMPRSVSMTSTTSSAPDDPLPPLPLADAYVQTRSHESRNRTSTASLETVGSSVLGVLMTPPIAKAGRSRPGVGAKAGSTSVDYSLRQKVPIRSLQTKPAILAFEDVSTTTPDPSTYASSISAAEHSPARNEGGNGHQPVPRIVVEEEAFKTIDASTWERPFPLNNRKLRAGGTSRHSMIEPSRLLQWRATSDPLVTKANIEEAALPGFNIRRPASVEIGSPLQWDRPAERSANRHSWSFPEGPKRGHKRQNCVRIANLPTPELKSRRVEQLPELEEEHQPPQSANNITDTEMGMRQPEQMGKVRPFVMEISSSQASTPTPSPFKNRPVLTPGTRPPRKQYINTPSRVAAGTPRRDPETFNSNVGPSNAFSGTPQQVPLSPTPKNSIRLNSTPPSVQQSDFPPYDSPILPSPALKSSLLYPQQSRAKGPRNPRSLHQTARSTYQSPIQNRHNPTVRPAKNRQSGEIDLRKSIMLLRSLNSEGRLLEQSSSTMYHDIEYERSVDLAAGRIRLASRPTSATNLAIPLENSQTSKLNHPRAARSALTAPHVQHLSASPSAASIGGASIWEDVSVRGESPEPASTTDLENAPIILHSNMTGSDVLRHHNGGGQSSQVRSAQRHVFASSELGCSHAQHDATRHCRPGERPGQQIRSPFGLYGEDEEENSHPHSTLVQKLEHAARTKCWDINASQNHLRNRELEYDPPQVDSGVGLGLIMDRPTLPSYG